MNVKCKICGKFMKVTPEGFKCKEHGLFTEMSELGKLVPTKADLVYDPWN